MSWPDWPPPDCRLSSIVRRAKVWQLAMSSLLLWTSTLDVGSCFSGAIQESVEGWTRLGVGAVGLLGLLESGSRLGVRRSFSCAPLSGWGQQRLAQNASSINPTVTPGPTVIIRPRSPGAGRRRLVVSLST